MLKKILLFSAVFGINHIYSMEDSKGSELSNTPSLFICRICQDQYKTQKELDSHARNKHTSCAMCYKSFKTYNLLKKHTEKKHRLTKKQNSQD